MADEVDYESDTAMAMEEEDEEQETTKKMTTTTSSRRPRASASPSTATRVVRGRGRGQAAMDAERYPEDKGVFDKLQGGGGGSDHAQAVQSVEGWILFVTGINEEAQEEDLLDAFGDDAPVKNLHMNLDRRTGFVKGYALLEFEDFETAKEAIERMDGEKILGSTIRVDWAFRKEARAGDASGRREGNRSRGGRR